MMRSHRLKLHDFCYVNDPDRIVSVIIPYFERRESIFQVIEPLFSQRMTQCTPEQVEIIVIDDGSAPPGIANELPQKVLYLWQRRIVRDGFAFGASRARNTGAKIANGEILVFLDSDILVGDDYIDTVLQGYRAHGPLTAQAGYILDYFFPGAPDPRTSFGVWENPQPCQRFSMTAAGNLAVPRRLFEAAGGFDEDIIYGGVEDMCFGHQMSCVPGAAIFFNRAMKGRHLPHPPSGSHADQMRSWAIVKEKHPVFFEEFQEKGIR